MKVKSNLNLMIVIFIIGLLCIGIGVANGGSRYLEINNNGFSFQKDNIPSIENKIITSNIKKINIDLRYQDIEIVNGEEFSISYNNSNINIVEKDDILSIDPASNRDIPIITLDLEQTKKIDDVIYMTIPENDLIDIDIISQSGDIDIIGQNIENINIYNSYGELKIENSNISNINLETMSGDIDILKTTIKNIKIESQYGDINMDLIGEKSYYNMNIYIKYGNLMMDKNIMTTPSIFKSENNLENEIFINLRSGDINLNFINV